jgi:hypothetical protein
MYLRLGQIKQVINQFNNLRETVNNKNSEQNNNDNNNDNSDNKSKNNSIDQAKESKTTSIVKPFVNLSSELIQSQCSNFNATAKLPSLPSPVSSVNQKSSLFDEQRM